MNDQESRATIEELAEYAHEAWAGWMRYLFSKCDELSIARNDHVGGLVIPPSLVARWTRQMCTPYNELSKEERDSDRAEALKMMSIFNGGGK